MEEQEQKILTDRIISKVEKDLKCYPDWLVKLEADGLGIPPRRYLNGGCEFNFSSTVESLAELQNELDRKVYIIERVYDSLREPIKSIVDLRYFRDESRQAILERFNISKRKYYWYRDKALERLARALGYID